MADFHSFIGLPVDTTASKKFIGLQSFYELDKYYKKVVHHQDFHLTCLFLGGWDQEKKVQLWERLEPELEKLPETTLTFSSVNIFGSPNKPRVFYAEPEYNLSLINLHHQIKTEAEKSGFPSGNKRFRPHVTLAKKWRDHAPETPSGWRFPLQFETVNIQVTKVCLYRINPGAEPKYNVIAEAPLKCHG